ncbi:sigma-54 interaction domain-containing protein [Cytobacillus firmus]
MTREKLFSSQEFLKNLLETIKNSPLHSLDKRETETGLLNIFKEIKELNEGDYKQVCDELYDGIYISDGEGKTLYVNKAYSRITGLAPDLVLNKYVGDLMKEGLYKNAITPEIIRTKKPINAVAEIRTGVKVLTSGNPIIDQKGNIKKVVVINRDMSDLLEMQEKLAASEKRMQEVEKDKLKNQYEIEHLRKLQTSKSFIGESQEMKPVIQMIHQVANLDVTVLITGETGVGKEVVANEIYMNSERHGKPFIKINCAAIPASLLESELFGYESGSFTGASSKGKIGMFELADKGTLLLDEIGEMPIELQSKLLRIIQEKEVTRIGGTKPIKFNVRILASTNCDLYDLVKEGKFREDLYFRLNVFPIHIPPLRIRAEDIEILVRHYLDIYNAKYSKEVQLEKEVFEVFKGYNWPGNIRELQNVVERMVIVSEKFKRFSVDHAIKLLNIELDGAKTLDEGLSLKKIVENVEKETIEKAIKLYGSTRKAAAILEVDQSTIVKKAKRLGISLSDAKSNRY